MKSLLRMFVIAVTAGIVLSMVVVKVGATDNGFDISNGDIVISSNVVTYCDEAGAHQTSPYSGASGDMLRIYQSKEFAKHKVTVKDSADVNILLDHVNITNYEDDACSLSIEQGSKVRLTLSGQNTIHSGKNKAGINVPDGAELTISASDTFDASDALEVTGGAYGAGIGGNHDQACGKVTITSGIIGASGGKIINTNWDTSHSGLISGYNSFYRLGSSGAGIGGGFAGSGGDINITGGMIGAGSSGGAGIGSGESGGGGSINISGGIVSCIGYSAGIGSTLGGSSIHISNGKVNALGYSAGIGWSALGTGGTVSISGGIIFADSDSNSGYCFDANGGKINISGGTILTHTWFKSNQFDNEFSRESDIVITGGSVKSRSSNTVRSSTSSDLHLATVTIPELAAVNHGATELQIGSLSPTSVTYSINQQNGCLCYLDEKGCLYFWLPVKPYNAQTTIHIKCGHDEYTAVGTINANNDNVFTAVKDSADEEPAGIINQTIVAQNIYDLNGNSITTIDNNQLIGALTAIHNKTPAGIKGPVTITINTTDAESVIIPASVIPKLAGNDIDCVAIKTGYGVIRLDAKALDSIAAKLTGDVKFSIKPAGIAYLLADIQSSLSGNCTIFHLIITSGKNPITSVDAGEVFVSIPQYLVNNGESNSTVAYAVSPDGKLSMLLESEYNTESGALVFRANGDGNYAFNNNVIAFNDVSGWSEVYVSYLSSRGLINGTGGGSFSPDSHLTRAQFITILSKMSGDDLGDYKVSSYTDVSTSDWYFPAVQWAFDKGIVTSTEGKFYPNADITRQDIAVILDLYAEKIAAFNLPAVRAAVSFGDIANISADAADSITTMQRAGIISGRSDGCFDPLGFATRAEAAKMVSLLLHYIINN